MGVEFKMITAKNKRKDQGYPIHQYKRKLDVAIPPLHCLLMAAFWTSFPGECAADGGGLVSYCYPLATIKF